MNYVEGWDWWVLFFRLLPILCMSTTGSLYIVFRLFTNVNMQCSTLLVIACIFKALLQPTKEQPLSNLYFSLRTGRSSWHFLFWWHGWKYAFNCRPISRWPQISNFSSPGVSRMDIEGEFLQASYKTPYRKCKPFLLYPTLKKGLGWALRAHSPLVHLDFPRQPCSIVCSTFLGTTWCDAVHCITLYCRKQNSVTL